MKKLSKIDKKALKDLNEVIAIINLADSKVFTFLSEKVYDKEASSFFCKGQDAAVNAFLKICCGEEKGIWELNDEFSTPGNPEEGKPVCWNDETGGFPPETIQAIIAYSNYSLKDKIKMIRNEYQYCLNARNQYV